MERFIFKPRPHPDAATRLLCFSPAGHGAAIYRDWGRQLPDDVEVCAVRLPGRENVRGEPVIKDSQRLLETAASIIEPYLDRPVALFGHSMGAWLAFEICRHLRDLGIQPVHLFVSGRRAPQIERRDSAPIHELPEAEFIAEIQRRYNGIPEILLKEPELLQLTLPVLRADLAALASHRYANAAPLSCAISCYAGWDDREVDALDLEAWRAQTTAQFAVRRFPGDHFYITGPSARLLVSDIAQTLAPHA